MVSDINAYSPASPGGSNAPGERYIPYSISIEPAHRSSIWTAFMQLVALSNTRCLAFLVPKLELLEIPAMMARFGIDEFQRCLPNGL